MNNEQNKQKQQKHRQRSPNSKSSISEDGFATDNVSSIENQNNSSNRNTTATPTAATTIRDSIRVAQSILSGRGESNVELSVSAPALLTNGAGLLSDFTQTPSR